jgi:hypothetical protein
MTSFPLLLTGPILSEADTDANATRGKLAHMISLAAGKPGLLIVANELERRLG